MKHLRDGSVTKRIQIIEERRERADDHTPCGGEDTLATTIWSLTQVYAAKTSATASV
jgi:hypothetical protein